jgi:hypothetical protein
MQYEDVREKCKHMNATWGCVFTASVNGTSGKFATDVKDASCKFMPVSMTPVVINEKMTNQIVYTLNWHKV